MQIVERARFTELPSNFQLVCKKIWIVTVSEFVSLRIIFELSINDQLFKMQILRRLKL